MKSLLALLIVCLGLVSPSLVAQETKREAINLSNGELHQALPLYKNLSGLELVIDSRVRGLHAHVTFQVPASMSKEEGMKAIEKALLEQARVVVTKLDDKRASVTYNDALPAPAGGHGH
jgi:hypothetical protein